MFKIITCGYGASAGDYICYINFYISLDLALLKFNFNKKLETFLYVRYKNFNFIAV